MRWEARALALGGLAAVVAAVFIAVLSAFGHRAQPAADATPPPRPRPVAHVVRLGAMRFSVTTERHRTCFRVAGHAGLAGCGAPVGARGLVYGVHGRQLAGLAGTGVARGIAKLTQN